MVACLNVLFLFLFRNFEQIDTLVSDLFFAQVACPEAKQSERCGSFPLAADGFWMIARRIGHDIPLILMIFVSLHLTWLLMFNPNKSLQSLYAPFVTIFTALAGPLLIVNLILKEYWGRPRPSETGYFGGDHPFVSPGTISNYCESNCSFVSGEASAGAWLLVLVLYLPSRFRMGYLIVAGPIALGISMLRVAFGRHYISDVTMAFLIVALCFAVVVWLLQTQLVQGWLTALLKFSNTYAFGRRKVGN